MKTTNASVKWIKVLRKCNYRFTKFNWHTATNRSLILSAMPSFIATECALWRNIHFVFSERKSSSLLIGSASVLVCPMRNLLPRPPFGWSLRSCLSYEVKLRPLFRRSHHMRTFRPPSPNSMLCDFWRHFSPIVRLSIQNWHFQRHNFYCKIYCSVNCVCMQFAYRLSPTTTFTHYIQCCRPRNKQIKLCCSWQ